jgi:hypothetical protein
MGESPFQTGSASGMFSDTLSEKEDKVSQKDHERSSYPLGG